MDETQTIVIEGACRERFPYLNDIGMLNPRPGFNCTKCTLMHEPEIWTDQLVLISPSTEVNTLSTRRKT